MTRKTDKKTRPSLWSRFLPGGAQPAKPAARRDPRGERWLKAALGGGAVLCVIGALAGGGFWFVQSGALSRMQTAIGTGILASTRDGGLALREVFVVGRKETDRAAILEAVDGDIGDPILRLDPDEIRERLLALGWIARAEVERHLPDTIVVRLIERRAAAIWQHDGEFALIDRQGTVIGGEDVSRHGHLKLVVGEGAPEETAHLLDVLEREPALQARVVAAVWMGERRWNLRLDNGVDVRLPEDDPADAWTRLARLERDHGLLARAVDAIDLRQPDRLIVRMTEDGATQIHMRRTGKNT
ncbi:cell division protein FtsQ/DivIB [Marivibrio halodurans]|uniref:Cell division protein FtsQ n=1 Tax=Marivibrio halodurans TaxID=2039722 RepID=A0A8J7RZY5_9PROT|nr:cell division protein FtsQ/DivIB [Marivibrio halodurans]MBP5857735.1 cell division protein FtsQ/DivIB [Marivibrio halodurans]